MWGSNFNEQLENLLGEDALCEEWMGEIGLHGMLSSSSLVGKVADISVLGKNPPPYSEWSEENKKKYEALLEPISNSLYLTLHYIPKIDCWRVIFDGKERFVSRKMLGWRTNEILFEKEILDGEDGRIAIEIYERGHVFGENKELNGPRLAFCLVYSKGLGIENEDSCIIAQYPLPERIPLTASVDVIRGAFKSQEVRLDKLGWEISREAVSDPNGKDYFGDYWMYESAAQYESNGVRISRLI